MPNLVERAWRASAPSELQACQVSERLALFHEVGGAGSLCDSLQRVEEGSSLSLEMRVMAPLVVHVVAPLATPAPASAALERRCSQRTDHELAYTPKPEVKRGMDQELGHRRPAGRGLLHHPTCL